MPRKAASSSSSSSDEDLTAFQSVAVTFEEITSKQKEVAEQAKKRIAGSSTRKRNVEKKSARAENGLGAGEESGGEDDDGPMDQLDPFQLKVAASLDSMLEGRLRLKEPGPKKRRREARAAERAEREVEAEPGGTFRFFARVKAGEPVVLQPYEPPQLPGTPFPELFRSRREPTAEEAAAALPALAVDGAALMAAAAASTAAAEARGTAGGTSGGGGSDASAAAALAGSPKKGKQQPQQQQKKEKKKKKQKQQQLGEGVVIDPRVFVPHDDRIRRLVGAGVGPGLAC
ncbi:hypothetical protein PLESTB_001598600 [Pleodorina starrii]|uniref:Uncharacterized protein n=1 Tax=Pleodorina starrii TaxID=330485 RepID=A0A9W6BYX4_9CHLO|nr:hypothetical protein PLESTM_001044800 [Pleodorina starrii]GLC60325.1 hypothetical protein PLESTB_001598600 [Pleodorina starrii]GLC77520.1 hypothetical protein PLESTF_001950200 [Pleodorina starrii]